jgi:hypothetical protein
MKKFNALLVDDDERNILEPAMKYFKDYPDQVLRYADEANGSLTPSQDNSTRSAVTLKTASTLEEAKDLLRTDFFQLALIDARLNANDDDDFSGLGLLSALIELRPSCERIVISNLFEEDANAPIIVREAHPLPASAQGRAHRLWNKDPAETCHLLIEDRACRWLNNQVNVTGADLAANAVRARARSEDKDAIAITDAEIEFLVSRLFGQGENWNQGNGIGISRVELGKIKQGFSSAAVLKARCFSANGTPGIWCVLKFASRDYIEQELVRYSRYVRFRLAMHHRVELLGWGIADRIGVLCYNFATDSPDSEPISLSEMFLKAEDGFFESLDNLQSPGKKGWYAEKCMISSLGQHFKTTYAVDIPVVRRHVARVVGHVGHGSGGDECFKIGDVTLELPSSKLFTDVAFTEEVDGCIVHGDMHCDNILVIAGNRPNLIDYYYVGNGPRSLDFATLESSVRLLDLKDRFGDQDSTENGLDDGMRQIVNMLQSEEQILATVWPKAPPKHDASQPFWVQASIHIARLAQLNVDHIPVKEYAATCVMWAMRLLKVKELTTRQKVRLLVWISPFVKMLKSS